MLCGRGLGEGTNLQGGFVGVIIRLLLPVGAAAMLGGLLASMMPMHLHSVDRAGMSIPCGDALGPSYAVASGLDQLNLDQHASGGPMYLVSNYVAQCRSLVSHRRTAAASVAAGGVGTLLVSVGVWQYDRRRLRPPTWWRDQRPLSGDLTPDKDGLDLGGSGAGDEGLQVAEVRR